ncbi:MAG: hypothetical protein MJK12_19080 [Colwellia sp.]|nr:hypothetical protein [Colwellia sp.]
MNKQLGLLWGLSLLITFYLGFSYHSLSSAQQDDIKAQNSTVTALKLLENNPLAQGSITTSDQIKNAINKRANKAPATKTTNITQSLAEIKSLLGNGMDMAGSAKAYIMISAFSEQDLLLSLEQLENTANQPGNTSLLSLLLSKYAEKSPQESLAYIDHHLTSVQSKVAATMSVVAVWARNDALASYDWFVNQNNDNGGTFTNNKMALYAIFSELTKQDFHGAIDKLIDISDGSGNNYIAVHGMATALTTKDEFAELMDRTHELVDRRLKDSVINSWVTRSPQEAIEWIETVDDTEEKTKLQEGVLSNWMISEPAKAANWYLSNAEPTEKQSYADKIIDKWSYNNPKTALDWLSQHPEIDQEKSTTILLKSSVYRNTDFVINNLNLLSDDKDKLDLSISIHRALNRNNKTKAAEFVAQSTIKEALEKKIMRHKSYNAN